MQFNFLSRNLAHLLNHHKIFDQPLRVSELKLKDGIIVAIATCTSFSLKLMVKEGLSNYLEGKEMRFVLSRNVSM